MTVNCRQAGFSLIELVAAMILVGILSITLFSRVGFIGTSAIQSSRDDLLAALFFAQQQAMMRDGPDNNIQLIVTTNGINVTENNSPIPGSPYPLAMPKGVALTPFVLNYDKLGRTAAATITITGSGNSAGVSASVRVEATGYAFAN